MLKIISKFFNKNKIVDNFPKNEKSEKNENEDGKIRNEDIPINKVEPSSTLLIGDNSKPWNPESINEQKLIEYFQQNNRSVLDDNKLFWILLFVFFFLFTAAILYGIREFYLFGLIDSVSSTAEPCIFWIKMATRLSFVACILCVVLPLLKLFGHVVKEIVRSKDEKTIRLLKAIRFTYILKYLGKIDYDKNGFFETKKIKDASSKEQIDDKDDKVENLSKLIESLDAIVDLLKKGK